MTELMEQALLAIQQLTDDEQDTIAKLILAEIESEKRWASAFEESQDLLAQLADEALEEHRAGKTKPLDLDDL